MGLFLPNNSKIFLSCGFTDMRKGVNGLFILANEELQKDSSASGLFVFRGKRSDKLKILYWDGQGFCIFYKRLEQGKFIWPTRCSEGFVGITEGQLAMLLEGIDWRAPVWSAPPVCAV